MHQHRFPGVQAYAAVGIGAGSAVFQVAFDWAAHVSQLAGYLVMAACEKFYLQQVVVVGIGDVAVAQTGQFASWHAFAADVAFVLLFVAQ